MVSVLKEVSSKEKVRSGRVILCIPAFLSKMDRFVSSPWYYKSLFKEGHIRKPHKSILHNHILEVSTREPTKPVAGTCVVDG